MGDREPELPSPVQPGQSLSEGTGTPTQLQNLQPTICPIHKIYWGKESAQIMRVDNPWLF